jgi:hypothetical protein
MTKVSKIYLSMLLAICSSCCLLDAMQQVYVEPSDSYTISIASGAFIDRLKPTESIASKRSIAAIRNLTIKTYTQETSGLMLLTSAEWLYWQAIRSIFGGETPKADDGDLDKILEAAQGGCKDARIAIRMACEALSYSDAIAEGEYSVKGCLRSRILGTEEDSQTD